MAQGDFTKQEAEETKKAFDEMYGSLSKAKKIEWMGHANDIYLFLESCIRNCPNEKAKKKTRK